MGTVREELERYTKLRQQVLGDAAGKEHGLLYRVFKVVDTLHAAINGVAGQCRGLDGRLTKAEQQVAATAEQVHGLLEAADTAEAVDRTVERRLADLARQCRGTALLVERCNRDLAQLQQAALDRAVDETAQEVAAEALGPQVRLEWLKHVYENGTVLMYARSQVPGLVGGGQLEWRYHRRVESQVWEPDHSEELLQLLRVFGAAHGTATHVQLSEAQHFAAGYEARLLAAGNWLVCGARHFTMDGRTHFTGTPTQEEEPPADAASGLLVPSTAVTDAMVVEVEELLGGGLPYKGPQRRREVIAACATAWLRAQTQAGASCCEEKAAEETQPL